MAFHVPQAARVDDGVFGHGNNGYFLLKRTAKTRKLAIVASDGGGWEHVSIHATDGAGHQWTPTWEEMCHVKNVFWDGEDVVMQLHPKQSEYVNFHPHTLHLWRPIGLMIPTPPPEFVGPPPREGEP